MKKAILLLLLLLGLTLQCSAQFNTAWAQSPYWRDGKAEFDIYSAQLVRYGVKHESEVIHILVQEPFSPTEFVKTEDPSKEGAYQVLKMNQILHVPTGIYVYQQMHSNFWDVLDGRLVKFSFTSNDSCGNTYKEGTCRTKDVCEYTFRTYWEGMKAGEEAITIPPNGYFYDELPMRVRTIDFTKGSGEFSILLAPSAINSKRDVFAFAPAQVIWKQEQGAVTLKITHSQGDDEFKLSAKFPFLLERWKQANGSVLELKDALKIPYWKFNKPGDKEKAMEEGRAEMKKWTDK
jgi:hypothetical protein